MRRMFSGSEAAGIFDREMCFGLILASYSRGFCRINIGWLPKESLDRWNTALNHKDYGGKVWTCLHVD